MRKKIVLTGGGTAGHITPYIALLPRLEQKGYDVFYIGSYDGMEKRLMADFQIPITHIHREIPPVFRFEKFHRSVPRPERIRGGPQNPEGYSARSGLFQRRFRSRSRRPGCRFLKIPCVIHESDMPPVWPINCASR